MELNDPQKGSFENGQKAETGVPDGQKGVRKHADSGPETPRWGIWPLRPKKGQKRGVSGPLLDPPESPKRPKARFGVI
jgi:hypothetical protein